MTKFESLLAEVKDCTICASDLALGPRPVVQASASARILIAGQAPGRKVHLSGIPFDDASGDRLREWMGITREVFYNPELIAIVPMGFCFPGTGKSGDLPPRAECAPAWRDQILSYLDQLRMTLVIGQYAQKFHFSTERISVTDRVKTWRSLSPTYFPLPHPSPRNNIWLRKNPWFEEELLPDLRTEIQDVLSK